MNRFYCNADVHDYLGMVYLAAPIHILSIHCLIQLQITILSILLLFGYLFVTVNSATVIISITADSAVLFYLSDAVTHLLEHKEEYTQCGVIRYFAE